MKRYEPDVVAPQSVFVQEHRAPPVNLKFIVLLPPTNAADRSTVSLQSVAVQFEKSDFGVVDGPVAQAIEFASGPFTQPPKTNSKPIRTWRMRYPRAVIGA